LKNKVKEDESILDGPILPDENNGHYDSVAAIDPMDGMAPLLEEEADSETDKEDMHAALEPAQPPDTDAPGVHAETFDSLKDFLVEEGQQDAPSDIHIDDLPEQQESSENSLLNNVTDNENISKPVNVIDSQSILPETHPLRDEPEMTAAADDAPGIIPADESTSTPAQQSPSVPAMLFAFIGIAGLAALLWINSTLSDRIDHLESQLSVAQKKIISINRRINKLEVNPSSHRTTVSTKARPGPHKVSPVILPNQSLPLSP